jgi:transcription elongation factor Elf1
MNKIATLSNPELFAKIFRNLFSQVAAKHGCHCAITIDMNNNIYVPKIRCSNCKVDVIALEYQKHQNKITEDVYNSYIDHLLTHELHRNESVKDMKLLKRA